MGDDLGPTLDYVHPPVYSQSSNSLGEELRASTSPVEQHPSAGRPQERQSQAWKAGAAAEVEHAAQPGITDDLGESSNMVEMRFD